MDKGDFTSKENKDQAREDLKAYIDTKLDEYDAKVKESNKDLSAIYLRKGIQDQYIAIFVDKNGRRSFYDMVLLERQTGVTTPNYLPYISGATILILLGIAFWPTKKRKVVDSI